MAQRKGKTGNPNGRPKGSPNKVTQSTKEWIQQIIDGNKEQFEQDLKNLEPKERTAIIERLLKYVTPTQQSISVEAQLQAEYEQLEKLLQDAPEEAIDEIVKRIEQLKSNSDNGQE
ncbi:conserved hypothetical protein [uncultured Paludibacter sp.]|uniref:DUF5681 domain-containing protein n=1 Tax=uncultured Paludibacter sp. TaxID=497635 RepID=A0A653A642_9BACT|nr:conserved hypothetical protein [uncultured Paludibacter sp.]